MQIRIHLKTDHRFIRQSRWAGFSLSYQQLSTSEPREPVQPCLPLARTVPTGSPPTFRACSCQEAIPRIFQTDPGGGLILSAASKSAKNSPIPTGWLGRWALGIEGSVASSMICNCWQYALNYASVVQALL
ncbi:hypothetical protein T310_0456 [Rasamsonia emersonii CBS 393.64]|uniref:Uncharacterized protein n=1 Tax=Rasamsonia emersonii (strain ATCC 16479 / CBS 393.64 / IMI 116815) TaxID=1408163 RepID=A0A0F4Z4Q9_RASE3|nr:hypothetical protein T310_0456 [Rasamsonia emersonii CBS 393.64]KKA25502.1 hypothetical protein T310_0456 [Rasamsonia emersonii CBS 393.64]